MASAPSTTTTAEDLLGDGTVLKRILRAGEGTATAYAGCKCRMHYVGTLAASGAQFDSSRERGAPLEFEVGKGVIEGWSVAAGAMRRGELAEVTIAAARAYGARGKGGAIPPHATLVFELELLSWRDAEGADVSRDKDGAVVKWLLCAAPPRARASEEEASKAAPPEQPPDLSLATVRLRLLLPAPTDDDDDDDDDDGGGNGGGGLVLSARLRDAECVFECLGDGCALLVDGGAQPAGLDAAVASMRAGERARFLLRAPHGFAPAGDAARAKEAAEAGARGGPNAKFRGAGVPGLEDAAAVAVAGSGLAGSAETLCELELLRFELVAPHVTMQTPNEAKLAQADAMREDGNAWFRAGCVARAARRYGSALQAIQVDCGYTPPQRRRVREQGRVCYANRAQCLLKLQRWRRARADCDMALTIESSNAKVLFRRGQALRELGAEDEALADFERVLELDAGNAPAAAHAKALRQRLRAKDKVDRKKFQALFKEGGRLLYEDMPTPTAAAPAPAPAPAAVASPVAASVASAGASAAAVGDRMDEVEGVAATSAAARWAGGVHESAVLLPYGVGAVALSVSSFTKLNVVLFGFGLVVTFIGACSARERQQGQPCNPAWARFSACFTMPLTLTCTFRFATQREPASAAFALASLLVSAFTVLKVGWPFAWPAKGPDDGEQEAQATESEPGQEGDPEGPKQKRA